MWQWVDPDVRRAGRTDLQRQASAIRREARIFELLGTLEERLLSAVFVDQHQSTRRGALQIRQRTVSSDCVNRTTTAFHVQLVQHCVWTAVDFEVARIEWNCEHVAISDWAEQAISLREARAEAGIVEESRRRRPAVQRKDPSLCRANVGCRRHEDDGVSSRLDLRPRMNGELAAHGIGVRQGIDTAAVRRNAENSVA